jgi:hypothetical protein
MHLKRSFAEGKSFVKQLQQCIAKNAGHLEDTVFKTT